MSKYLVETFYTCTFKIIHKLEELNEKKLSELENRKDGKVEIIEVRLNNRKTKTVNEKNQNVSSSKSPAKNIAKGFSFLIFEYRFSKFVKKAWNSGEVWLKAADLYKTVKNIFFLPNLSSTTMDSANDRSFRTMTGREFL